MYHDSAQLVWEGNGTQGKSNVEKFLQVCFCLFLLIVRYSVVYRMSQKCSQKYFVTKPQEKFNQRVILSFLIS